MRRLLIVARTRMAAIWQADRQCSLVAASAENLEAGLLPFKQLIDSPQMLKKGLLWIDLGQKVERTAPSRARNEQTQPIRRRRSVRRPEGNTGHCAITAPSI